MFDSELVTTPQGWYAAHCTPEMIEIAQQHHAARFSPGDKSHIESSIEEDDARWSWYLGEMVVDAMLAQRAYDYQWLSNESDYEPDFRISGMLIDVKTKNRVCAPRLEDDWFASVRHDQFVIAPKHGIKGYIFCDYDYKNHWVYVLGKLGYDRFAAESIHRQKGDYVHDKHTTRVECHDIALTKLMLPLKWQKAA